MSVPDGSGAGEHPGARLWQAAAIHSAVIARLDQAIQYSRESGGIRMGRSVLDSPLSRGMTAEFVAAVSPALGLLD
ncbi:hypothetical protein AYJ54_09705 [Bradyrhizobium centrolobii]|uniref:Uncharacterized protein n=1 Tax=Bradyrhizobium centrolobii TaxID=1505087 RepID=A0A176YT76_9BRAD|nr:hypothetical protein AYJ54_09705 [Bradyrhizobium centrolobii]